MTGEQDPRVTGGYWESTIGGGAVFVDAPVSPDDIRYLAATQHAAGANSLDPAGFPRPAEDSRSMPAVALEAALEVGLHDLSGGALRPAVTHGVDDTQTFIDAQLRGGVFDD